jgi:hypothetical protein
MVSISPLTILFHVFTLSFKVDTRLTHGLLCVIAVLRKITSLPNFSAIPKLTGSLEATKFVATVSEKFPDPIAGALLALQIGSTLAAAAELVEEAEEEQTTTSSVASSSTSSSGSAAPTATEYVVCLNQKWPSLLIDAFVEAFPEDGIQADLDALHLSLFTTKITDELADIVSLLPIFTFVVPDEIPGAVVEVDDDDDDGDSTNSAQSLKRGSNETWLPPRQEALTKRAFNTQFPLINGILLSDLRFAPPLLTQISNKAGSTVELADAYLHEANIQGGNVIVYVFDTGFGNDQSTGVSFVSSPHSPRH